MGGWKFEMIENIDEEIKKWENRRVIFKLFMTKFLSYRLSIVVFKFTI